MEKPGCSDAGEKSQKTIIDQAQASFAATPPEQLEGERDAKQLAILGLLPRSRQPNERLKVFQVL